MASKISIPMPLSPRLARAEGAAQVSAQPAVRLRRFAWAVVAYNILVILWGAVVRATGSGNGCGDHWPLCGGTVVQHWQTMASVIEFAHRATSAVAVLTMAVLAVWTWRSTRRRHMARVFVAAAGLLTLNEGLLGALLVLLHHTGTDQSPMRAFWLSLHLANTLLLLAMLALTAHFLGRDTGRMRGGVQFHHPWLAMAGLLSTLAVGVSGSLAALGDTLYPAHSLAEAFAQDFAPHANWLLHIRWVHPTLSLLAAAFILCIVAISRGGSAGRLGLTVASLVGLQMVLGAADVLLLAPTWLQVTHLLGADLLWVSLVVLTAQIAIRPIGCAGVTCTAAARAAVASQARDEAAAAVGA